MASGKGHPAGFFAQNHSLVLDKDGQKGQGGQEQPALLREEIQLRQLAPSKDIQVIRASEGEMAAPQAPLSPELVKNSE